MLRRYVLRGPALSRLQPEYAFFEGVALAQHEHGIGMAMGCAGRGLAERQRVILEALASAPNQELALWELIEADRDGNPDDYQAATQRTRSAVRALERRGLVYTYRAPDERRGLDTTTVVSAGGPYDSVYVPTSAARLWHGTWVRLGSDPRLPPG